MSVGIIRSCPRMQGWREREIATLTSAVVLVRIPRAQHTDAQQSLDFRVRCLVRPGVEARPTPFLDVASRVDSDPAMLVNYANVPGWHPCLAGTPTTTSA